MLANNPEVRKKYLGQNFELRKAVLHERKSDVGTETKTQTQKPKTKTKLENKVAKENDADILNYAEEANNLEKSE